MIINQPTLDAFFSSASAIFNQALREATTYWPRVAMVAPSSARTEYYGWLGHFPSMREWVGDRVLKDLKAHEYSIKNKKWESTVEVDADDIRDDVVGVYAPIFSEMGRAAAAHPDELVFDTLVANGNSTVCYDGQYFFDTDHPVGSGTSSNYGGGSGNRWMLLDTTRAIKPFIFQSREEIELTNMVRPDDENVFMRDKFRYGARRRGNAGYGLWQLAYASDDTLNSANYAAAREAMMAFENDEGRPLGVMPNLLVVGPSNEKEARDLVQAERLDSGATNVYRNTAELLVVPWMD